jgi:hypothetical protein
MFSHVGWKVPAHPRSPRELYFVTVSGQYGQTAGGAGCRSAGSSRAAEGVSVRQGHRDPGFSGGGPESARRRLFRAAWAASSGPVRRRSRRGAGQRSECFRARA